jgi:hypothetical protein
MYHTHDRDYRARVSSNFKYVVNLGDVQNQTYFTIDTGQNGRLFHRHYGDMTDRHEKGELIKFTSEFMDNKYELTFLPKK